MVRRLLGPVKLLPFLVMSPFPKLESLHYAVLYLVIQ